MSVLRPQHRPRDTQRQRIYDAERVAFHGSGIDVDKQMTLIEVESTVHRVLQSEWWRQHVSQLGGRLLPRVIVADGRARRSACAARVWDGWKLSFPRRLRTRWIVLHELAHVIAADGYHSPVFAAAYLDLVARFMGRKWERRLVQCFAVAGVRAAGRRLRRPRVEARVRIAACVQDLRERRRRHTIWGFVADRRH